MRTLSEHALKLVTLGIPIFLAACYGAPYRPAEGPVRRTGKAVDKDEKRGIGGLKVTCVDESGVDGDTATTGPDGSFELFSRACHQVRVDDVDGEANGKYESAKAKVGYGELVIQLSKSP